MDHWKPSGPSHPLITAAIAVVLAWTTSLVIFYHGVFYGTVDDTNESIIGLAKLSMAVPIVLTGVSLVAALRDWHSRIVWGTAGLQLFFSCSFFLLFFPIFPICLLFAVSAYFQFRTAASLLRNMKLKAEDHSFR